MVYHLYGLIYLVVAMGVLTPPTALVRFSGFGVAAAAAEDRGAVAAGDGYYIERLLKTFAVKAGGQLEVDTQRGAIHVESWDREEVQVEVEKRADVFTADEAERLFADFAIEITANDGDLQVQGRSRGDRRSRLLELRYTVKVPGRFNVELETIGGQITVGALQGEVRAETSGGNIEIGHISKGSVDVHTSGGSVRIDQIEQGNGRATTSGGSIEVGDVTGNLDLETSGGSLRVASVGGMLVAETAGGSITIGRGGKSVMAATAGGSIQVDESGGDVEVRTAGGGIRIGPVKGNVVAETAGGSIQIGVSSGSVNAATAGGSIKVEGSGGPVEVETAGGSIQVRDAHGYVEAETAGGGIEVGLADVGKGVDMHCYLETSGGDVRVVLPAGMAATVDAEVQINGWSQAEYDIYSAFPLQVRRDRGRRIRAGGEINGGGHLLKLSTENGDIHIEKR